MIGGLVAVGIDDRFVDDAFFVSTIGRTQSQRQFSLALTSLMFDSLRVFSIVGIGKFLTGLCIGVSGLWKRQQKLKSVFDELYRVLGVEPAV